MRDSTLTPFIIFALNSNFSNLQPILPAGCAPRGKGKGRRTNNPSGAAALKRASTKRKNIAKR